MSKQQYWMLFCAILLFIGLMGFATRFDLQLSQTITNYHSYGATVGQTIGSFPLYLVLILSGEVAIGSALRQPRHWLALLEFAVGLTLSVSQLQHFGRESSSYFFKAQQNMQRGVAVGTPSQLQPHDHGWWVVFMELLLYIIITIICQWWLHRQSDFRLHQLLTIAIFASGTVFLALTVNVTLKTIWGRYRPYEVQKHLQDFTNWYHINGPNGHYSFPSGHTMAATLALVFSWFGRGRWHRWLWRLGLLDGILIALSRLIIGAHFLSDVTFSFFITALIIYVMQLLLQKYLRSQTDPVLRF
ncbi:phosphatase PAP2 family protein [Fructilactobacillus cliffordii]|uniref:Phosphatase PAP2 family protein n=1 Tax=Fructilactobacillus cliffordii TaxID=2940299 RepID=A0A9Q8ZSQ5_9LACO|nr:phosphatase PAP2 family protein [Fructilactobacillus cliffordii]USS88949.1 phosphatase PAP2 family protein [Fructilactobacillus cliffordii]